MLRVASGFVVNPAANQAHPGTGLAHDGFTRWSLQWIEIVATGGLCRGRPTGAAQPVGAAWPEPGAPFPRTQAHALV
jgi:hypothetical protein